MCCPPTRHAGNPGRQTCCGPAPLCCPGPGCVSAEGSGIGHLQQCLEALRERAQAIEERIAGLRAKQ
jgi:hypothetical protein